MIKKYEIREIEAALIKLYLESHNIKNVKNKLLLDHLDKNRVWIKIETKL